MDSQPHEERTHRPDGQARGIFVGRQRELAELKAAVEDALSGRGRLVMLAGEPGIGKTRLAQEVAFQATALGFQVLRGWCYEAEGAPPYWPWVQPIRSYFQQRDPEQLRAEMGPGAADIAEVIPELGEKLPDLKPPPALEPEQARFRLFDSITTFLKNAAQSQPLMLVLDDLHWADQPSLLLLQFLARQLGGSRLLVVGCYRDVELSRQHPLSETLAQLSREPAFQRKLLRGLSQEDTGRFIEVTAGREPPPRLVETVYAHTEGNPFFTKEVVRLLSEQGELTSDPSTAAQGERVEPQGIRIPEGVREVIGQRLNRLSEECNQVLTTASVIGRDFDFKLLHTVCRGDSRIAPTDDQLLQVVDEALNAHLIEGWPGTGERYQFTHALIQQTLSEELSTSRRVRLHARIAEALEILYGPDASGHAAELAYHFAEAQTVLGPEKLVRYSLLAGEQALAAYAYEDALLYFQRALAAKEGQSIDAEAAALLFGAGRAQLATLPKHQLQQALTNLSRAFDYYAGVGDVARSVAVAVHPGFSIRNATTAQLIARALALAPPDSHEAGLLLTRYGQWKGLQGGDYDTAQKAFSQALAIAQREADMALEMQTLVDAASVDFQHLRWQGAVEKGLSAIELAHRANDPGVEVSARYFINSALSTIGDLEGIRRHASAMLAPAERLRSRFWLAGAFWKNAIGARLSGDWQAARDFTDRGLAASPKDNRLLSDRIMLEYEVGDFTQGEAYLEQLLEVMRMTPLGSAYEYAYPAMLVPMVAHVTGVLDRLDVAKTAAELVLASPSANPNLVTRASIGLALLAVQRGDAVGAREQCAALEFGRGTMLYWAISGDRLLGLVAQTMGRVDQAAAHFEDALAFCRKAGYRPELAWTCYDYAEALLQRDYSGRGAAGRAPQGRASPAPTLAAPDHRAKAIALLEEALAISRELGMRPLMERVSHRLERLESPPSMAPAYPDNLTQREVEVLRLVAAGKSNPEIGEALVISLNTVARHVSNIFTKTGVANRAEAATYALRHGLAQ